MLPQVTFRGLPPSAQIMEIVCRKASKLSEVAPELRGCHVVVEASPRGSPRPTSYRVSVQLSGGTEAGRRTARHAECESLHAALNDVFRTALRQLKLHRPHERVPASAAPASSSSLRWS